MMRSLPLFAMLACGGALAAQQAPPDPLRPADAVAYARDHSPAYRQIRNDLEVSRASTRVAWSAFLPSLSIGASTGAGTSTVVTGEDDAGQPIRLSEPLDFTSSSSSQSIGLDMTLFDGGGSFRQLGIARAEAAATRARIEQAALALDARVLTLYWQAAQRERAMEVEAALLNRARERLVAIGRMVAVAAAGPEDVLGAEADVATQELALERARSAAARALLALLEAMGAPLDGWPSLLAAMPEPFDPAALDAEALVARALAAHPAIAAAAAAAEAAADAEAAARASYWPRITAGAGWGRSIGLSSYEALLEPDPQNRSFSFGLSASLPVFQGFRTQLAAARASAALDDAHADVRATRLAVSAGVRVALLELHDAWRTLVVAERVAELSADRFDMAHERYRNGALGFTELQSLAARAERAEREAMDARFALEIARVALTQATAGPIDFD